MRSFVAGLLCLALLAPAAGRAEDTPLGLGSGSACVLVPARDVRKRLGLRGQHLIACASPAGTVTRVFLTRAGRVACTDTARRAADGTTSPLDQPCRTRANRDGEGPPIPPVVNLSGRWRVDTGVIGSCTASIAQNGAAIEVDVACPFAGGVITVDATGTLSFADGRLSGTGTSDFCGGAGSWIDATAEPDGQRFGGAVGCGAPGSGGLATSFSAHRAP